MRIAFRPDRIKTLRETLDITVEEMAGKLGKVKQQVSIWETGVNAPSLENLILICNTFNVSPLFFLDEVSSSIDDKVA